MRVSARLLMGASCLAMASTMAAPAFAQDTDESIEEVVVTGARGKPRTATQSPVPIDSFNSATIERQGNGDMTETLKNLIPSFSATPLTGDGSAFVRSTSLRGLPPDEALVLVNSKRRHRSALIAHFGAAMNSGSHAADIGMIPSIALKNVEVLRDGAAAQYGSDAIAGVMNFILKDSNEGGQIQAQLGEWYEGETDYKVAGNVGFGIGDTGFINISAEYTDNAKLSRGFQHAAAIDVPNAQDPAMNWGRPESHGLRTAWNSGFEVSDSAEAYFFGNYADTYGNYGFFYRAPGKSGVLIPLPNNPDDPYEGNFCWCDSFPAGFTPFLEGDQTDLSAVFGVRGDMNDKLSYDISGSHASNKIKYTLNNTLNPSWGFDSPQVFNPGDLKQRETNFNADFSYAASDVTNIAFGLEWREEAYTMYAGDRYSWDAGPWANVGVLINPATGENYGVPGNTSNGLPGTSPDAAGTWARQNWAAYVDVEWDLSDAFLLQGAVRFEDFSDFGTTLNGKLAARYTVSDAVTLRGAISTGFRAPTPGQSNYTGVVTTFDGVTGLQTQQGTLRPTDPLSVSLGGKALEAEKSFNMSFGMTAQASDNLTFTVDIYHIRVDDRIVKTQFIPVADNPDFSNLSFYTNALETKTQGLDIVALYDVDWESGSTTNFSLAYNYNDTEVTGQTQVNGIDPVSQSFIDNIENNLPKSRISATVIHTMGDFSAMIRANHYSKTQDERGAPPEWMGAETVFDVELSYNVNESFTLIAGANNVFDNYPDEVGSRVSQGMPYPRRTPIGYHGGMMYLRGIYNF